MRLWHPNLLCILPRQQLLGQNRECCLIESEILSKGKVNNILVDFVNKEPQTLLWYHDVVTTEMYVRGYTVSKATISWKELYRNKFGHKGIPDRMYPNKFNDKYLLQCLHNLEEKHDCGGISDEEWDRIIYHVHSQYPDIACNIS